MLSLKSKISLAYPLAIAVLLAGGPALARTTVHHWVTEDGVYSYTDDTKKIPQRYKAASTRRTLGTLKSYSRYTPSDRRGKGSHADRLPAHLEQLRKATAAHVASAPARGGVTGDALVIRRGGRNGNGVDIAVGIKPGAAPIEVEERRLRPANGNATRSVTIVRRGDDVLAVIKPQLHNRGTNEGDEDALLDD